ncbi:MAG: hypothetical protein JXQ65_05495 [Candidatus Marinimicrobia bacterium]|nr:hypothetical protein [Candidatus Neomarinimicrobiota bacterium]
MGRIILLLTLVAFWFFLSCEKNSTKPEISSEKEFIIYPEIIGGEAGFKIKDIHSGREKFVKAVEQLHGKLYLPVMSSIPLHNNKIVQGDFIADTNYYYTLIGDMFKVTRHLRDTSLGFYGE